MFLLRYFPQVGGYCRFVCSGGETGALGTAVWGCLSQQVQPVAAVSIAVFAVRASNSS